MFDEVSGLTRAVLSSALGGTLTQKPLYHEFDAQLL